MKAAVIGNAYLYRYNDSYYGKSIYNDRFFYRYTSVFNDVYFPAKIISVIKEEAQELQLLSHKNLHIVELPVFKGFRGLLTNVLTLNKIFKNTQKNADIIIYRMTQIEGLIAFLTKEKKTPHAVEVINDIKGLYPLKSKFMMPVIRRMLKKASGIAYVTENFLQSKYQPSKNLKEDFITASFQTNDLEETYVMGPKKYTKKIEKLKIIHVSNRIDNSLKGHKIVLSIVKELKNQHIHASVNFVGTGSLIPKLKSLAMTYGLKDQVFFVGRKDNKLDLIKYLRKHDLFVFPSKSEGIARVGIEAMAAGLPCLVSSNGGQKEYIDSEYVFDYKDYRGFANKILELISDPHKLNLMSQKNYENCQKFLSSNQIYIRNEFYNELRSKHE